MAFGTLSADMKVIANTYPIPLVAGDEVEWRLERGCFRLYRQGAGKYDKPLFVGPEVDKMGRKRSNGQEPTLIDTVAEIKRFR